MNKETRILKEDIEGIKYLITVAKKERDEKKVAELETELQDLRKKLTNAQRRCKGI